MTIKLNRPGNISRNSLILTVSFFAYVIISSFIIINIDEGNFAARPVYEEYFGKFFVIGHLGVLSGFVFLIAALIILNKTGHMKNPHLLYIEQEKKEFKERYHLSFKESITRLQRNLALTAAIASLFLPAALPLIAVHYFNVEDHTFAVVVGIILMFIAFYKAVGYMMSKSQLLVKDILKEVNNLHKDTNLVSTQYDMDNTPVSAGFDMAFEGRYKGRNVNIEYTTVGFSTGKTVRVNTKSRAVIETSSDAAFTLAERETDWKKYEFRSIDDGFVKRFNFNSPQGYYPAIKTKEICLMYNRLLNLQVNKGELIYEMENADILPYYSIEGMILFLDFMITLADSIDSIDSYNNF